MSDKERLEALRVFKDGAYQVKDDVGWTTILPPKPRNTESYLYELYRWGYLCVRAGGIDGIDRRRNRPAAYYAEWRAEESP